MKISYNWLKEYIDIKESPEKLAGLLTGSGSEVKAIDKAGGDSIMEIEVTPNRADCQSYLGIGREVAAVTGRRLKVPVPKPPASRASGRKGAPGRRSSNAAGKDRPFTVEIKDKALCPRYTARLIRDVKVGPSPGWLVKRITAMGLRPVNNAVDITNFCLFELGEPMHAFDYDRITGRRVIIRRAEDREKIVAIDRVEHTLSKDMLVIADTERPIAVAGVMGGLATEVNEGTKNILLECAIFDPVSVRRTSHALALFSDSSYRFERGIDPDIIDRASQRAAGLMVKICGGKMGDFADAGGRVVPERRVRLHVSRLNRTLNLELSQARAAGILKSLSFNVRRGKGDILAVGIPSFRADVKDEIDLIEEAARLHGYANIRNTIPRIVGNLPRKERSRITWERAREFLLSCGMNEVITYSLIAGKDGPGLAPEGGPLFVKNPLSAEQAIMRPSLLPGLLNVIGYNVNRRITDLNIFEIGNVYWRAGSGHKERMYLSVGITGAAHGDWQRPVHEVSFFDLKGVFEGLFGRLGLGAFTIERQPHRFFDVSESAVILYKGEKIGVAGRFCAALADRLRLAKKAYAAELDIETLFPDALFDRRFQEIPRFPSTGRDISMIVSGRVSFDAIASLIKEEGGSIVESVRLFDKYSGKQIPAGSAGLALSVEYRDRTKTLRDEEVNEIHSRIRRSLADKFGVRFR